MNSLYSVLKQWSQGIRLYIGLGIALLTVVVWAVTRAVYGDASTAAIRLQESYAWLAVGCMLLAMAIGPVFKTFSSLPGKRQWFESRRLIGIGAAWFASLHVVVAYADQFNWANPFTLPTTYQRAFLAGFVALLILLALALTSFNAAMKRMGLWWFRLHRLLYIAVLLVLWHAFIIGVHAVNWPFLLPLTVVAVLLFLLYFYQGFVRPAQPSLVVIAAVSCGLFVTIAVLNYGFTEKLGYNPIIGRNHGHQERK